MNFATYDRASKVFLLGLFITSAVISPFSADPVSIPKLVSIAFFSSVGVALCFPQLKIKDFQKDRLFVVSILTFIAASLIATFFSDSDYMARLYGITGRNIGLIAFVSLCGFSLLGYLLADEALTERVVTTLILLTLISASYGLFQFVGVDPVSWDSDYGNVFGFLGNPNFQSALMGLGGIVGIGRMLAPNVKIPIKMLSIIYVLLMLASIRNTNSQQGYLVFLVGLSVIFMGSFFRTLPHFVYKVFLACILLGPISFFIIISGADQDGLLVKLGALNQRFTYWSVGLRTWKHNPLIGTGLDTFAESFRSQRNVDEVSAVGGTITNSAHNYFIDLLANGGLLLFLPFAIMNGIAILAIYKFMISKRPIASSALIVIAVWVGLFTQALISPYQIGLMVWFWACTGLVVGLASNSRYRQKESTTGKHLDKLQRKQKTLIELEPRQILGGFLAALISLTISLPPYIASVRYVSALKTGQVEKIYAAASIFPMDVSRSVAIIDALTNNDFRSKAHSIALTTVEKFPNSFISWNALYNAMSATPAEKERAMRNMKRLDPQNPNLK